MESLQAIIARSLRNPPKGMDAPRHYAHGLLVLKEIRHPLLPPVDWDCGVNQSDPLVTDDNKEFNHDSTMLKRKRTLENVLVEEPQRRS